MIETMKVMITMFVGSGLFVGCVLGWSFKIRWKAVIVIAITVTKNHNVRIAPALIRKYAHVVNR